MRTRIGLARYNNLYAGPGTGISIDPILSSLSIFRMNMK